MPDQVGHDVVVGAVLARDQAVRDTPPQVARKLRAYWCFGLAGLTTHHSPLTTLPSPTAFTY